MPSEECQRVAARYVGVPEDFPFRPGIVEAICDPSTDLSGFSPEIVEQLVGLSDHDQAEVLRFVSLLRAAGSASGAEVITSALSEERR